MIRRCYHDDGSRTLTQKAPKVQPTPGESGVAVYVIPKRTLTNCVISGGLTD